MSNYHAHQELVKTVLLYLHTNFTGHYRENATGAVKTANGHFQRYGQKGSTDIIGHTGQGRAVYVEVKTGNSKLSKEQQNFKKMVLADNCIHLVIYNEIIDLHFHQFQRRVL